MSRLLVVIGVASLAWIAVIVTILLLITVLGVGKTEATEWREPPWYPPQTLDVTVTQPKDCSTGTAMHRALCRTTP